MTRITVDDWEQALAELKPECADQGFSSVELARRWGCSNKTALDRLKLIRDTGRLVVGMRAYLRVDQRMMSIPVYSLRAKATKRKTK